MTQMLERSCDELKEVGLELYESQNEIIRLQGKALDSLVSVLVQHRDVDEAELESAKQMIDRAAQIRAELSL